MVDATPPTLPGTVSSEEEEGPTLPRPVTLPTPFDEADSAIGPLTVICRVSGSKRSQKIMHLLTPEGRAVGCGWLPSSDKYQCLAEQDIKGEPASYSCCSKCFKLYTWPTSWRLQHGATSLLDEDSLSSCGSLTDDSVDTASENEQAEFS